MPICPLCHSDESRHAFSIKRDDLEPGTKYSIWRCSSCSYLYADGPLNDQILDKVYSKAFHGSSQQIASLDDNGNFDSKGMGSPIVINAYRRVDKLKKSLPEKSRLLDVGAGKGYFVKVANSYFDAEGLELSQEAAEYGKKQMGVNIHHGNFLDYPFENQDYDAVTLWDVVACFNNPHEVFSKVSSLVRPGGSLILTVPDSDSLISRSLKRFWPLVIPPISMGYYNLKSLDLILSKYGFRLVKHNHETKWVTLDFLIRKALRTFGMRKLSNFGFQLPMSWKMPINTGDILFIEAQKEI